MRQLCLHPGGSVVPSFVYSLRGDRLRRHRCRAAAAREIRAPRSYKPGVYGGLTLNCGGGTLEIPGSRINIRLMTCFDCKLSLVRLLERKFSKKLATISCKTNPNCLFQNSYVVVMCTARDEAMVMNQSNNMKTQSVLPPEIITIPFWRIVYYVFAIK